MTVLTPTIATLAALLLQAPLQGLPDGILGQAILAVVAMAVVILVGRIVLSVAWKLVIIAAGVVGLLWLLSVVGF